MLNFFQKMSDQKTWKKQPEESLKEKENRKAREENERLRKALLMTDQVARMQELNQIRPFFSIGSSAKDASNQTEGLFFSIVLECQIKIIINHLPIDSCLKRKDLGLQGNFVFDS